MKIFFLILIVLIVGCSGENTSLVAKSEVNKKLDSVKLVENDSLKSSLTQNLRISTPENDDFLLFYNAFIQAVLNKKGDEVNTYLHQNYGLYVIESKGALPMITKVFSMEKFYLYGGLRTVDELDLKNLEVEPVFESLPKVICDTTIYDKQGCFAAAVNPLQKSRIWDYSNLNEKEIQAIEFLAETVSITVVNTANFTFYFSKIEDKWFLTFLDLRMPCEA